MECDRILQNFPLNDLVIPQAQKCFFAPNQSKTQRTFSRQKIIIEYVNARVVLKHIVLENSR